MMLLSSVSVTEQLDVNLRRGFSDGGRSWL